MAVQLEQIERVHVVLIAAATAVGWATGWMGPGSVALGGPDRVAVEAVAVNDVVDTTGAGDSFAAGFLGAFSRHRDVASSLVAGARQAALTVRRFGAFDAELKPWPGGKEPA